MNRVKRFVKRLIPWRWQVRAGRWAMLDLNWRMKRAHVPRPERRRVMRDLMRQAAGY